MKSDFILLMILSVAAAGSVLLVPVYLLRGTARQRKTSGRVIRGVLCGLIALTVLWLIWLYAYYHADSRDNLPAAGSLQNGSPELPTPENLYSKDSGIDMFVHDAAAYVNAGDVDWVTEQDFTAGEQAGTIKATDVCEDFQEWDATVLPAGTKIYESGDPQILLAECDGELIPYLKYVEG